MKRFNRIAAMMNYLLEHPRTRVNLEYFVNTYDVSKATVSDDLNVVDSTFQEQGIGKLKRVIGPSGGIQYIPKLTAEKSLQYVNEFCNQLSDPGRILPGGYLYMTDILGDPVSVRKIGQIIASAFAEKDIDVVMTVETKGIPIAYAVASFLNVPVLIVRRDPKVTEGSSISINYVSGSSRKIQTMVLTKRSLHESMNVCIIDDFMKAGGTINGMISLVEEFGASTTAIAVLAEADDEEEDRVIEEYTSLIKISNVDMKQKKINVQPGNFLENFSPMEEL
ncbi:pur operon repressor [Virgibacillus sp. 179-BFC.A HS]|uniref:Pur operon repressor n=1 Tax=Tigheibacillus jepli TaxID=3035914 RepID=A0ABU5CCW0_9BACI|nr:pur operon repressor [Virgibacillus sp. 179-BFC.A HS]MDY0404045.1 pur operon repressor [Virgibacillus sp. 179-BFC.A HS]